MVKTAAAVALPPHSVDLLDELVRRLAAIDPEVFFATTPASRPIPRPAPHLKKRMPHSMGEHFPACENRGGRLSPSALRAAPA